MCHSAPLVPDIPSSSVSATLDKSAKRAAGLIHHYEIRLLPIVVPRFHVDRISEPPLELMYDRRRDIVDGQELLSVRAAKGARNDRAWEPESRPKRKQERERHKHKS